MNEYIRMAEAARAMIVNKISFDPRAYHSNPIPKGIGGLHSVAISVGDPAVELRIVSIPAEKAITGWMCESRSGGLPLYPREVEKLILLSISIANYSMGLIMLKASDKIAEPFIAEIGEMDREADAFASKILAFHDDVYTLHRYARKLANMRNKPLRQSSETSEHMVAVLTLVDAMRAIILKYADDPPP